MLGVLTTPFVGTAFFYPILSVAPGEALLVLLPVVMFWVLKPVGRASLLADARAAFILAALLWYLLAANPLLVAIIGPGAIVYVLLALLPCRTRSEVLRKIAVLIVVLLLAVALRWPWYVFGLFADSPPALFPNDFAPIYSSPIYASILFQGTTFGWAGTVTGRAGRNRCSGSIGDTNSRIARGGLGRSICHASCRPRRRCIYPVSKMDFAAADLFGNCRLAPIRHVCGFGSLPGGLRGWAVSHARIGQD